MGQILIRNLEDTVLAALKRRAEQNRTSAEEEARRALAQSVGFDAQAWRQRAEAIARRIAPAGGPDSTSVLRAERYGEDDGPA